MVVFLDHFLLAVASLTRSSKWVPAFGHGLFSEADPPIYVGAIRLAVLSVILFTICYSVLKSGWKIKN